MKDDFILKFARYPDEALIGIREVAVLLQTTEAGLYKRLQRGTAPPSCLRRGKQKQIRFRVSDVREWLNGLEVTCSLADVRMGRPRNHQS